jgi:Big-like domain-containing protein/WD40 repeat protein
MRRPFRALVCALMLVAGLCGSATAATTNGQLAAVADGRLLTFNANGSGLRAYPVADAAQISELAFSPDGNRLAFIKAGELSVLDLTGGRVLTLTPGEREAANPGWSLDGSAIAFRRGLLLFRVPAEGGPVDPVPGGLVAGTTAIAWEPDAKDFTLVVGGLLLLTGLDMPPAVSGQPAWAPDKRALAFPRTGGLSVIVPPGQARPVFEGTAGPPRWSGDSGSLVFASGGDVRTLALANGAVSTVLVGAERLGPVDWQPCVPDVTLSCESVASPRCSTAAANVTTQADQPIDLPAPPCVDPAGRPLSLVVVKPPDHGTVDGLRYTPAAGYSGQDTVGYRVDNGVLESETFRVTVFVVPRGSPTAVPVTRPPVLVQGAPFLSASATPRLDRKRTTLIRVSCDQDCSLSVRLTATLRKRPRRAFAGRQTKRSIAANRVVRLRLRLPSKPRGTLKTVWVTGRVRNAAGDTRSVKLPVRLPR